MTFYCAVPGCSSNSKTTNYTFHRLPRNVIARARWILALGCRAGTLDRCALVCRRHFEECMLRRGGRAVGLIKNAVPTLFIPPKRPIQPALSSEDTDNEEGLLDSEPENQSEDELSKNSHPHRAELPSEAVTEEELVACRACLTADGRMYAISGSGLEDVLAALTGVEMPEAESFPRHLCVFCMTRLSKCAAFRDRCHRSTALLRTLVEEELLTMNNIKMVDRETHKLTNGLTPAALYHFQTHPVLDILPAFSENQNKDTQQEPDYTEIEYLETDNGAEEDIKVEMVNENSDANSDDDDDVEYKPENDISDVDTDTLEEALVAIERERKSVKPGKDIVKYGEVNKNVKTKVYKYPTGVETDESEETVEIRRKVKNKKHLLQKHSTKTTTVKKSLFKESLAAFSKDFNCTIKVLNKEQQRQEVEERKGNNKSAYCCDLCGKGFRKKSAVMKHLSYHDPSLPHECDACRLRFRSRLKLLKHRQSHRAVYTCNECGYASRFRTYIKNHWLMHKGTTYTCPYCQIVYNHQTSYYNHIRIQHPGENEACDECGETFAAGRGMNLHKALAHRTSDKSNSKHKCKDCDVKFLNAEALQRHEELGAGVPHAALWPCAACGDSCGSDTALKAHAAEQHTDRHHCDECNKTFLNSESFELHVQRKHMNKRAVEGPFRPRVGVGRRQPCVYVCEICGKVFKNSTLLQYHMNGHLAVKPFQCKQCPKTFPRQGALNLHMRVHTGERPYQCEQCPQAFASPSNLSRHTKYRHTKYRELVKCNICGKLLRAVSLSLHVRTVHQNLRYERKRNPKRTRVVAEP